MKKDDRSIADLCRPLSAKIMPGSATFSAGGGHRLDPQQALMAQRRSTSAKFQRKAEKSK